MCDVFIPVLYFLSVVCLRNYPQLKDPEIQALGMYFTTVCCSISKVTHDYCGLFLDEL